jgi:hypothetical protein
MYSIGTLMPGFSKVASAFPPPIVNVKPAGFTALYAVFGAPKESWKATIPGHGAAIAGSASKIATANAVAAALSIDSFLYGVATEKPEKSHVDKLVDDDEA